MIQIDKSSTIQTEEGTLMESIASDRYKVSGDGGVRVGAAFRVLSAIFTESVLAAQGPVREYTPYEYCRDSGVLSFWDDPREDVYGPEDGEDI